MCCGVLLHDGAVAPDMTRAQTDARRQSCETLKRTKCGRDDDDGGCGCILIQEEAVESGRWHTWVAQCLCCSTRMIAMLAARADVLRLAREARRLETCLDWLAAYSHPHAPIYAATRACSAHAPAVLLEVCQGLDALHAQALMHGDLRPSKGEASLRCPARYGRSCLLALAMLLFCAYPCLKLTSCGGVRHTYMYALASATRDSSVMLHDGVARLSDIGPVSQHWPAAV